MPEPTITLRLPTHFAPTLEEIGRFYVAVVTLLQYVSPVAGGSL